MDIRRITPVRLQNTLCMKEYSNISSSTQDNLQLEATTMVQQGQITLYTNPVCFLFGRSPGRYSYACISKVTPLCHRVHIALHEAHAEYTEHYVPVPIPSELEWFNEVNSLRKVRIMQTPQSSGCLP